MNARRMLQFGLFLVLGLTVALMVKPRPDAASTSAAPAITGDHAFAVYYMHGDRRCETCISIETQTETAVRTGFATELENGTLVWGTINTDQPANAHYNEEFALTHSTVVLIERNGNQTVRFTKLDEVWDHVWDEPKFREYVQREVGAFVRPASTSR
jgi:hypothetical protein